jgi:hypothetical protein
MQLFFFNCFFLLKKVINVAHYILFMIWIRARNRFRDVLAHLKNSLSHLWIKITRGKQNTERDTVSTVYTHKNLKEIIGNVLF